VLRRPDIHTISRSLLLSGGILHGATDGLLTDVEDSGDEAIGRLSFGAYNVMRRSSSTPGSAGIDGSTHAKTQAQDARHAGTHLKAGPIALLGILFVGAVAIAVAELPSTSLADSAAIAVPTRCEFHHSNQRWTGSCGAVFDENPVFSIAPSQSITTGIWQQGPLPKAVWAGVLKNEGDPDFPIEIEVYARGKGVLRSEYGWFNVSGFSSDNSTVKFQMDASHEVPPGPLDRAILKRADAILSAADVWNRADDRKCPPAATSWSIYCAGERATIEITGGFHHRRPALELVREIVDERSKGRNYDHRLIDYNNDRSTTLADVHSLFAEAMSRIPE
jgi:hypothetical protein